MQNVFLKESAYLEGPSGDIEQSRRQLNASFVKKSVQAERCRSQQFVVEEPVEGKHLDLQLF